MSNAQMNQCDGCRRKLPLIGGAHRNPDNWLDAIGCTADRYASEAAAEAAAASVVLAVDPSRSTP